MPLGKNRDDWCTASLLELQRKGFFCAQSPILSPLKKNIKTHKLIAQVCSGREWLLSLIIIFIKKALCVHLCLAWLLIWKEKDATPCGGLLGPVALTDRRPSLWVPVTGAQSPQCRRPAPRPPPSRGRGSRPSTHGGQFPGISGNNVFPANKTSVHFQSNPQILALHFLSRISKKV